MTVSSASAQSGAFRRRIDDALGNEQAHSNFRSAMNMLMQKRALQFTDPQELLAKRERANAIRAHALRNLPDLLEQLEQRLVENGIQVHWALDSEEANRTIHQLLQQAGARSVVKGKSMVSEEIGLNHYLEQRGIEILESDLGEFIIQLAHEMPSHIVMPAIHKTREEIAALLHKHFPELSYSEDVDELTQQARQILRDRFRQADAGISGVNFMVAESGTLCLVENEGNGRMSTTVPALHIAVTGIEKVVERLSDVPPLLELLTKSATGQPITTYFNMITHPRQAGERDGPEVVHLVLVDNGRSRISRDPQLLDTLRCIRCGSCINHCPVYVQVGGHAYGTTYPGPIGTVLEPMRQGLDQIGVLTSACSLCGACAAVCPVQIPLPRLINRLRAESVSLQRDSGGAVVGRGSLRGRLETVSWRVWRWLYATPSVYRLFARLATRLRALTPTTVGGWSRHRTVAKPAPRTLGELARAAGIDED
jgi:L-lactate dehydrogenase complex protein LldF